MPHATSRRLTACALVVGGFVISLPATSLARTAPGSDRASGPLAPPRSLTRTPSLEWRPCGGAFECTTLAVPADYSDPGAGDIPLAITRRPAEEPSARLGALVINYGGPGDPGTETLRLTADSIPAAIRRRFDLVSFDPRGTGSSRPVDCVDDTSFARAWSDDRTPDSDEDLQHFYDGTASSVDLVAECVAHNGQWLARVGTRNVARDLDRLRAALGEARLDYLGYSYGTVIGAVYAQEFPQRVRALVLDSAVDLSSSMAEQQHENAAGFERALGAFLDDCASRQPCAFAPFGDARRALDELRTRFEGGLRLATKGGRSVGGAEFYVAVLAALYSRAYWPYLAEALRSAREGNGRKIQALSDVYAGRRADGSYSNYQEVLGVIVCDDQPEPLVSFDEYRSAFEEFARDYPFFGPMLGGSPLGCDRRLPAPRPDEVVGDVRTTDAPPALVIGTTHDPATPYAGAEDLARRLGGSRLLTVEGTSHGSYALGNECVDRIVDRYLITRRLPRAGTRCSGSAT